MNPQPRLESGYVTGDLSWEEFDGRYDPEQRFALYRLCECNECGGRGKINVRDSEGEMIETPRCSECRGEGRVKEILGACATEAAYGVMLITLGREGELEGCAHGCLDRQPEEGQPKWVYLPWLPSPRNASDAGKLLRSRRK